MKDCCCCFFSLLCTCLALIRAPDTTVHLCTLEKKKKKKIHKSTNVDSSCFFSLFFSCVLAFLLISFLTSSSLQSSLHPLYPFYPFSLFYFHLPLVFLRLFPILFSLTLTHIPVIIQLFGNRCSPSISIPSDSIPSPPHSPHNKQTNAHSLYDLTNNATYNQTNKHKDNKDSKDFLQCRHQNNTPTNISFGSGSSSE